MRMMVITGVSASSQMYMMRTSALVAPKGVSITGSKCIFSCRMYCDLLCGGIFDAVQEPALRHAFVLKVREREFAHAEVPVGMARPFDVQVTRKAEIQLKIFSHQFIHNGTVVNPPDGNSAAVAFVEELVMSLPDVGYGDGLDP